VHGQQNIKIDIEVYTACGRERRPFGEKYKLEDNIKTGTE